MTFDPSAAPNSGNSFPDPAALPPDRRWFVMAAVLFMTVLFLASVAVLYHSWLTVPVPSATLVIGGSEKYADMTVEVERLAPTPLTLTHTLSAQDNYSCRFHLDPGLYTLRIKQGERLVRVHANLWMQADTIVILPVEDIPATAPAARP